MKNFFKQKTVSFAQAKLKAIIAIAIIAVIGFFSVSCELDDGSNQGYKDDFNSLNGIWYGKDYVVVTIRGNTGYITQIYSSNLLYLDALTKNFNTSNIRIGEPKFRNLTPTGGYRTWTGEELTVYYNGDIATGTTWEPTTIVLSDDGLEFYRNTPGAVDPFRTWTRGTGGLYPPDTPEWLRTTGATVNRISLSWEKIANAEGYYVYRSSSYNGHYDRVGNTKSTSYTDTGLTANKVYYYKVSAFNRLGESSQSGYVYATTLYDGTTYITISGTPRVGQTLTVKSAGSGWQSNSYMWGYNRYSDDPEGTFTMISGETGSTFTITSDYKGRYIRAFRRHPSGNWVGTSGSIYGQHMYSSNFLGPIQ
ncbi:MAG: fibronectin type III domain-containing protein [Treponema sp.]|jgi:hypothetical protein|nr:fibronectin type III domain-containing protein [Treponema sp.]